eukprot:TRINITY_DN73219_c0_g1_i1.p1 TRINITY_DN73219_c0_g1~~TRINITY_DN73219_c0_g1_i1.p1  ORF type:complete len:373 (+),score=57.85 TRINITY_DN73219_c0_g1_i1:1241-2359(+)
MVRILNAVSGNELWNRGRGGDTSQGTCGSLGGPEVAFLLDTLNSPQQEGGLHCMHAPSSGRNMETGDSSIEVLAKPHHISHRVLDDNIQHAHEPALSADEAFARTVERQVYAEQVAIPVGQITSDWVGVPVSSESIRLGSAAMTECSRSDAISKPARSRTAWDLMADSDASLGKLDVEALYMAENRLGAVEAVDTRSPLAEPVQLLEYSRTPESFGRCLEVHPVLRDCRCKLQRMGLAAELESGARIFVAMDQYAPVLRAIEEGGYQLRPRHVIAQQHFLSAVTEAVESLKGMQQVHEKRTKRRLLLALDSAEAGNSSENVEEDNLDEEAYQEEKEDTALAELPVLLVKNTFIHMPIPSSLGSEPSSGARTV